MFKSFFELGCVLQKIPWRLLLGKIVLIASGKQSRQIECSTFKILIYFLAQILSSKYFSAWEHRRRESIHVNTGGVKNILRHTT